MRGVFEVDHVKGCTHINVATVLFWEVHYTGQWQLRIQFIGDSEIRTYLFMHEDIARDHDRGLAETIAELSC